jgi:hypothetical protein
LNSKQLANRSVESNVRFFQTDRAFANCYGLWSGNGATFGPELFEALSRSLEVLPSESRQYGVGSYEHGHTQSNATKARDRAQNSSGTESISIFHNPRSDT